jgi:cyclohexyl-isocyanide hydratase
MVPTQPLTIGLLLFPKLTQLDLTGPYEVFVRVPAATIHLIWKTRDPVGSDRGLAILPTAMFETCPTLDVIVVPGGPGQVELMDDAETLDFLRRMATHCRLVTSVCTGSLVLGAAGLLRGYRATCHWASLELAMLGAEPVAERIVRDRNRITGAGVTSGIDFALAVVSELVTPAVAEAIQLQIEYDPAPPFRSGSPRTASPELVAATRAGMSDLMQRRRAATDRAAVRLARSA